MQGVRGLNCVVIHRDEHYPQPEPSKSGPGCRKQGPCLVRKTGYITRMENSSEAVTVAIIFSDYVVQDARTGKLTLVGCFNGFQFPSFPSASPNFFITVSITNLEGKLQKLFLTINIKDRQSGLVVASAGIELHPRQNAPALFREEIIEVFVPFGRVQFPRPGAYEVEAVCMNSPIGKRVLMVKQLSQESKTEADKGE